MIWVTPQSKLLETLHETRARHVVTFASPVTANSEGAGSASTFSSPLSPFQPQVPHHLNLIMNDIAEARPGLILPQRHHIEELLAFDHVVPGGAPLIVSCYAGISRSTAAAFIVTCARQPERDECELAQLLRRRAPVATPNPRMITLADELLQRGGRMVDAIAQIGRGGEAFAGTPFQLS